MNSAIRALFLDIGGVLGSNGWDRSHRAAAAEKFDLDPLEMNERHHLTFDIYEEGKLTLDEYVQRVVFYKPRSFSPKDFKEFMFAQSQPFPEMIELCTVLKAKYNLKVVAVSNEGRELTEHRISKFNLRSFIDFFISSAFVHHRKPDRDIFSIALDASQIAPQEIIYIDDRALFVEVAEGLGLNAILHSNVTTTKIKIEEFGLKLEGNIHKK